MRAFEVITLDYTDYKALCPNIISSLQECCKVHIMNFTLNIHKLELREAKGLALRLTAR